MSCTKLSEGALVLASDCIEIHIGRRRGWGWGVFVRGATYGKVCVAEGVVTSPDRKTPRRALALRAAAEAHAAWWRKAGSLRWPR